ncbi:MAG: PEP-CTERM sorting domain-containing protein [Edaphobacter sp.]|uniref:PEP-CTERM sorting domain-containing protein n=1 Tax=Edaphobacter sp. TaxID=1934404 RepID=UPI002383882F|nr:PEP-CTERM sorting domain-containing protein [Edaphobacter sp.]MDE1176554.1 PEP-CTERM sorting domain-containing protein [Edaphobacter sp.]
MRHLSIALALALFVGAAPALLADSIPYPNAGTPAPNVTLIATATGDITGYFLGQSAGDDSVIRMVDVTTGYTSAYFLPNHTTAIGTSVNFGAVNEGDVLVFELLDTTSGIQYSTDAAANNDGYNHGYATDFAGGVLGSETYPAGTYIGFEDTSWFDYDYNDNQFLFTNTGVAPTPEPGSLILLGTGMLGVAGVVRRKMFAK